MQSSELQADTSQRAYPHVTQKEPTVLDKINSLDEKIEHPESLKFSFSRQKYVEEVKKYKKIYFE